MNEEAEKFLDLYKRLEQAAKAEYFPKSPADENIIGRLLNHSQFKKYKEDLNYCRIVRNFLTHNPKVGGEYPLIPSEAMTKLLEKLLKLIASPTLAVDIAIKKKHIFVAYKDDKVSEILRQMDLYGFSNVPIMEKGKLEGIFTDKTIYMYVSREKELKIDQETTLRYFEKYLKVELYVNELFVFVPSSATVPEVENIFEQSYKNGKMLSGIFITKKGSVDEQIIGILTPWDFLGDTYIV